MDTLSHGWQAAPAEPEPPADSRRAARRAVDVACDVISSRWDGPVAARCTDLSPHGMWLETPAELDEGERVVLCFRPPRSPSEMTLFARVGRVLRDERDRFGGTSGAALAFVGASALEVEELEHALRGLPPVFPGQKRSRRMLGEA